MRKKMFCLQTMISVSPSSMLDSAVTCWIVRYGVFCCISVRLALVGQILWSFASRNYEEKSCRGMIVSRLSMFITSTLFITIFPRKEEVCSHSNWLS